MCFHKHFNITLPSTTIHNALGNFFQEDRTCNIVKAEDFQNFKSVNLNAGGRNITYFSRLKIAN